MPNKRSFVFAIGSLAAVSSLSVGLVATHGKQPVNVNARPNIFKNVNVQDIGAKIGPVITGTVTAVDGAIITVSSKLAYVPGGTNSPLKATTYTVDASHATVNRINPPKMPTSRPMNGKDVPKAVNAPSEPTENVNSEPLNNTPPPSPLTNIMTKIAVSDIKIGDMVTVRGTVNGTTVTATDIIVTSIPVVAPIARPNKAELEQKAAELKKEVEAVKPGLWSKITNFLGGFFGKKK